MRTARAEVRLARGDVGRRCGGGLHAAQVMERVGDAGQIEAGEQPFCERDGDAVGVERALHREEPGAALVLLADADRHVGEPEQLLPELHLDERALLLHHDGEFQPAREVGEFGPRQRPRAADLQDPDAERVGGCKVEPQQRQRLQDVQIGFADGRDADPRARSARGHQPVDPVLVDEGQHRVALEVVEPGLLRAGRRRGGC